VTETSFIVEVAYAKPDEQLILTVACASEITVQEAIDRSGLLNKFPEIDLAVNKVGVFGKIATLQSRLHPGDRVEIYRPLIADPKEARKRRAAAGKARETAAGENVDDLQTR
jgi:putative ubiquitin-RnfH superfamily antitoxin RatB of RatAB toxin-antitoxin module